MGVEYFVCIWLEFSVGEEILTEFWKVTLSANRTKIFFKKDIYLFVYLLNYYYYKSC